MPASRPYRQRLMPTFYGGGLSLIFFRLFWCLFWHLFCVFFRHLFLCLFYIFLKFCICSCQLAFGKTEVSRIVSILLPNATIWPEICAPSAGKWSELNFQQLGQTRIPEKSYWIISTIVFPFWQSYFINLFDAGLQWEIIHTFLSSIVLVYWLW